MGKFILIGMNSRCLALFTQIIKLTMGIDNSRYLVAPATASNNDDPDHYFGSNVKLEIDGNDDMSELDELPFGYDNEYRSV
jgi:hypothetical protein